MHKMANSKKIETVESVLAEYAAKCARLNAFGTTDNRVWHGAYIRARNKLVALGTELQTASAMIDEAAHRSTR